MDVSCTYCGNHCTIYVSQTIMLYALNLYGDVCQLFLNKTGEKINRKAFLAFSFSFAAEVSPLGSAKKL